ncbi:hypothetical protein AVEN_38312-1 [Araneus ventricosus]|uniref:Uncharacterized protein n=1 Tax=Araneus ventricosus TaxID=182803 RepID=A0A4Y2RD38_ARAVE|nr:hypothetical protein AVEN_71891-1 [Araneus ventricosus]GBN73709.1 hypothetical protein AVEN_38312-1 [Araneus ventricosus]
MDKVGLLPSVVQGLVPTEAALSSFTMSRSPILMKIEEDRMLLQRQREPGRPGRLGGVDKKLTDKEERARLRAVKEENQRIKYVSASTSIIIIARRFLFEFL